MSNIDKRALREAAERAGQNDWEYVYTSDLSAPGRGYITVGGAEAIYCLNKAAGGVKQSENVLRYIAAASPETMLALLDELEAAGRRIAELEAREVQLPPKAPDNLASCLDGYEKWLIATTFRDTWNACLAEVVRVNAAAGKGEAS
ncbi:ead/Ea22-like family protein [Enterobacter cloacae]|uniref:ead/Ea22-like family protein n=1 Tax=Enterobacter cloacae TaxID=550 RepID=UPI00210AA53F|nr:ead/Ea22-like family protein [Enterobacter cloacae]MCQ4388019.1 ead/Ea22-like family protein [Enterobacter cloacae]HDC4568290.1 ead/Ea22-like family protein [Enterobacter cloacae]HDC4605463.1 ead/Ea22-like family protein [Enterobacter cloacae]